jgi:hypothetical protein
MTHDTATHVHDPDPPKRTTLGRKLNRWTEVEINKLHDLYNRGFTRAAMAAQLNMTEERVRQRLQWESNAGTLISARRRRRAAQRLVTKLEQRSERQYFDRVAPSVKPTDEALRLREARMASAPRDLTGLIMGDPPIGFSALEQRA